MFFGVAPSVFISIAPVPFCDSRAGVQLGIRIFMPSCGFWNHCVPHGFSRHVSFNKAARASAVSRFGTNSTCMAARFPGEQLETLAA
jgi:hypothetical protein